MEWLQSLVQGVTPEPRVQSPEAYLPRLRAYLEKGDRGSKAVAEVERIWKESTGTRIPLSLTLKFDLAWSARVASPLCHGAGMDYGVLRTLGPRRLLCKTQWYCVHSWKESRFPIVIQTFRPTYSGRNKQNRDGEAMSKTGHAPFAVLAGWTRPGRCETLGCSL